MNFLMLDKYYWKNIKKDINNYVKECLVCLKAGYKIPNTKNVILKTTYTNELWELDLLGPFRGESGAAKFILVSVDHYSKWVDAEILNAKDARTTHDALIKIIKRNGSPEKILTDNGLEFRNQEIIKLKEKYGFQWIYSSAYHHKTVGAVERVNGILLQKLKKLNNFNPFNWEKNVKKAVNSVNLSYNRVLRTSPYIFKYGESYPFKIDKTFGIEQIKYVKDDLVNERNKNFYEYSKKYIQKGKKCDKRSFDIDEKVLIYLENVGGKLSNTWFDGYKIKEKLKFDSYIVTDGKNSHRLNKSQIKKDTSKRREESVVANNNVFGN